ncbi:MAG: glycosyl transferase family 1, partial [Dolichospermum sp.]
EEDMVNPGCHITLAHKIREVVTNPYRLATMSISNLEKAKNYKEDILQKRRIKFYNHVKEKTQTWLSSQTKSF